MVWSAAARDLKVTVLRPFAVLGVHPTSTWSAGIARAIAEGHFALYGDGLSTLAYVHVDNLADAVVLAARSPRAAGQAYNIVDGQTTVLEFADQFRRWLGAPPLSFRPEDQAPPFLRWRGRYSGDKAARKLGYAPPISYAEAMAEAEQFVRSMGLTRGK